MMAFFLVMWLVGQSKAVKSRGRRLLPRSRHLRSGQVRRTDRRRRSAARSGRGAARAIRPTATAWPTASAPALEDTAKRIKQRLAESPDLRSLGKQIEIQVTRDGLRIELRRRRAPDVLRAAAAPRSPPAPRRCSQLIARELGKLKNSIVIEGHTDSRPYAVTDIYSNWELSADRANAARRVMERGGLHAGQVRGVRGYADRQLRVGGDAARSRATVACRSSSSTCIETSSLPAGVRDLASGADGVAPGQPACPVAPLVAAAGASHRRVEGASPH